MSTAEDINADEFLRGQQACIDGEECPEGASESFERGYRAQYGMEQIQTFLSEGDLWDIRY